MSLKQFRHYNVQSNKKACSNVCRIMWHCVTN